MSAQSNASAKRRRAGTANTTPIFRSEDGVNNEPSTISQNVQEENTKRPMSLQQVITVFDQRLLHLEKIIIEQGNISRSNTSNNENSALLESLQVDFKKSLETCVSEFDHRYNILANEVIDMKKIILKLQTYTLDINQHIIKEHLLLLNEKQPKKIDLEDDLQLSQDLNEIKNDIPEEVQQEVQQEVQEEVQQEVTENTDENEVNNVEAFLEEMVEHVSEELKTKDVYSKDSEPWDQETEIENNNDTTTQILEDLSQQHLETKEDNVENNENEKKGKKKKKEKKSISVSIENN